MRKCKNILFDLTKVENEKLNCEIGKKNERLSYRAETYGYEVNRSFGFQKIQRDSYKSILIRRTRSERR